MNALRRRLVRRSCHLVALDRIEDLADAPPPAGVEVRAVTESEVGRVRDFRDEAVATEFRRLLAGGDRGVDAVREGRVVGHFWGLVARGRPRRAWGGVDVRPGEALLAWGSVREDLRGRGIFQAMIRALVKDLFRAEAVRRVISDVPLDPPSSLAAHRRCGFRLLGRLSYVSVCGLRVRHRFEPAT